MITRTGKKLVYNHIEEALLHYGSWVGGEALPKMFYPYLEALETPGAISGYVGGLKSFEKKAVGLYLHGNRVGRIAADKFLVKNGVKHNEIRMWVYGNKEQFGLVNTMFHAFMKQAEFCPFCHDTKRRGAGGYFPRLSGNVCPHRELWEMEKLRGMDG